MALRLLRAARKASLASRTAAAAASRAASMASRSAREAARKASFASRTAAAAASRVAAMASCSAREVARLRSGIRAVLESYDASTKPRYDAPRFSYIDYFSSADYERLPDDAKSPTDKDFESDEATWALYERWCKAFNKERDHAEMVRRFKLFRYEAKYVHHWNTHVPPDPEKAAIYFQKREEAKLLISKGQDVSNIEEWQLPMELGPFADGGDPFITESNKRLLKEINDRDFFSAVEDVKAK